MRHRAAVLIAGALAVAGSLVVPGPAQAAVDGIDVRITEAGDLKAGGAARTVEVVVSSERDDRRCFKVRWSLLIRPDGTRLRDVRADRVEETGSFPVRVEQEGSAARLTDRQLDPGTLCRGRTVTARYRIAVAEGADEGALNYRAQAFDQGGRLLAEATAAVEIEGRAEKPSPSPSPSESPSPSPSPSPSETPEDEPAAEETETAGAAPIGLDTEPTSSAGSARSLLGPGLVVGALLVFAGVGLLLRMRLRGRATAAAEAPEPPTGFYVPPSRRAY